MKIRDTLSKETREEFDRLLQQLPPSDRALLRIIEIFMEHEVAAAAMLNGEVRELNARQGADLVDHELRLRDLERGS